MIAELRHCPAPAKLNLFLHVTGRRPDGYHLLETVFELIDLSDSLGFTRLEDGRIERAGTVGGVPADADLTVRAARLLAERSGCRLGVRIEIDKRIPMGGGLGGGSSDAATTLLALNRLWDLNWPRRRLARLALTLGADVPVFVFGRAAYATGIGERLRPLALPARAYVLVAPRVAVPTAGVFAAPELTRDTKPLKISGLSRGEQVFRGRNDLQRVVVSRQPKVAEALEALRQAAREAGLNAGAARMTGSGACVFLPLHGESDAHRVRDRLAGRIDADVSVCRSLATHPLRDWAFERAPPSGE
ncbi:MAG: 4-(cytidine 5'-diphospho)-2-C-methyl-D-erythritol kinase [Burkholderiaceae bacterium]